MQNSISTGSTCGSKVKTREAKALHRKALKLRKTLETSALDLGAVLAEIKDGQHYRKLGYMSFLKYAEHELQFSRKKAYMVIEMYKLTSLSQDKKIDLGVSKVYEIFLSTRSGLSEDLQRTFADVALKLSYQDCCIIRKAIRSKPENAATILSDPETFLRSLEEDNRTGFTPVKTMITKTGTFSQKLSELQNLLQSDDGCFTEEESKDLLKALADAEARIREFINELNS